MVGEHDPAPRQPVTTAAAGSRDARPLSPIIVCGVGVLVAAVWLGAIYVNVAPATTLPAWLRGIAHTPLTLTVPALVIPALFVLLASPHRAGAARHARSLVAVQALALVVVALPSLLPISPDLLNISPGIHFAGPLLLLAVAVRVPALSLGVAVAMADPLVVQRMRTESPLGPSPRALAGVACGATLLVAGVLLTALAPTQCSLSFDQGDVCVIAGTQVVANNLIALACFCAVCALLGVWLGYALGAAIARADRWA